MMKHTQSTATLVSVITPVYNGADHVGACIESVARSITYGLGGGHIAIEHIIIDDGSTDGTLHAIDRAITALGPSVPYVNRVICIPHSGRPSYARNRGIETAQGKYIYCLDHDDMILQNSLRYLADHLKSTATEIAYGDFLGCNEDRTYVIGGDYWGSNFRDARTVLYSMFKGEHFFQHSFMFSKRLWQQVGGYDEAITFGEDFDLCVRFILAGHIPTHLPVTTFLRRDHKNRLTACYDSSACRIWFAELRSHYGKHLEALCRFLTSDEIAEIRNALRITVDTPLSGPPSRELAMAIASGSIIHARADSQRLCDIA